MSREYGIDLPAGAATADGFDLGLYRITNKPEVNWSLRNIVFGTSLFFLFIMGLMESTALIQHPTTIRHFVRRSFVGGIEPGSERI